MKYLIGFVLGVFSTLLVMTVLRKLNPQPPSATAQNTPSTAGAFDDFYKRFHSDSVYQIEHILFPLQGLPAEADSATLVDGNFYWQKDDWKMHKAFDTEDNAFQVELQAVTDNVYEELIFHKLSGYAMIRRFAKVNEDWYLTYYSGMNKVQ